MDTFSATAQLCGGGFSSRSAEEASSRLSYGGLRSLCRGVSGLGPSKRRVGGGGGGLAGVGSGLSVSSKRQGREKDVCPKGETHKSAFMIRNIEDIKGCRGKKCLLLPCLTVM